MTDAPFILRPKWNTLGPNCPRCGRGATPQTLIVHDAPQPNPMRRTRLVFRFRPLSHWPPERINQAMTLLKDYFELVGGFRTADDAVMKAWVVALETYPPAQIAMASREKARQLRPDRHFTAVEKRKFVARPENFPRDIERLLAASHEFADLQEHEARKRQSEASTRRAIQAEADLAPVIEMRRKREAINDTIRDDERRQHAEQFNAQRKRFWSSLTDAQRLDCTQRAEAAWKEGKGIGYQGNGSNPHDQFVHDRAIAVAALLYPATLRDPSGSGTGVPAGRSPEPPP